MILWYNKVQIDQRIAGLHLVREAPLNHFASCPDPFLVVTLRDCSQARSLQWNLTLSEDSTGFSKPRTSAQALVGQFKEMRISGCGHLLMPTGRTSVQSTTSGISLCLNPHYQGTCQWLRQRSINFLSSDFRILSPSHVFSMNWDCDRVSRSQPVKETHDEPEGKTNDLRNRGKRHRNPCSRTPLLKGLPVSEAEACRINELF